jgi:ABC-type transport system involved in multi-copper enzyme maturation permease subunit
MQVKRKIKLRKVFEREFSDLIIIQLIEFYIASKPIYRKEILVEKVILTLIVIVNIFLVVY